MTGHAEWNARCLGRANETCIAFRHSSASQPRITLAARPPCIAIRRPWHSPVNRHAPIEFLKH
ncbi:hypothetical protein E2C01_092083 [Portunus trituberculatus]|uniref:Uncharacterized protein n=1 Tax=Portunus trituberculatus TaxID=210409 RepID=A0A5B7JR39_PORTR|nr:hypothetical protein [Portunus trituberculatus]